MPSLKFKKKKENFVCENPDAFGSGEPCGTEVKGGGFTNHCPHCLFSKHVDNYPGDRAADCGGLMEPIDTEESGGEWKVIQKCRKCGKIHKNKISINDNFDHLVKINKDKN